MIRYIETISVERSEAIPLAAYHLRRVRETLGEEPDFLRSEGQLVRLFRANRPAEEAEQYKLRLVYSAAGIEEVSVNPYTYDIRRVRRLQLVELPSDYRYDRKYLDRELLDRIAASLPDHETVALLTQGGRVTDTTFTNVCLRHDDRWETPDRPLLEGTRRRSYLDAGAITAVPVSVSELLSGRWREISLINAMNPLGRMILPITSATLLVAPDEPSESLDKAPVE